MRVRIIEYYRQSYIAYLKLSGKPDLSDDMLLLLIKCNYGIYYIDFKYEIRVILKLFP